MSLRVLFFASLADLVGTRELILAHPAGFPDVGSVFDKMARDFPSLEKYRSSVLCALNSEFTDPGTPIHDGDEVAFFPPVSGG